jgi:acyl carrier protein
VVREDLPGGTGLVAYVVPRDGGCPAAGALRELLRRRLPEPMVPAHVVTLDRLPRTATGKVDRRYLARQGPLPERAPEKGYVPPRTPIEERLAAVWAAVLRLDRVGVEDDFFDLGGHSLSATQVVLRLNGEFQMDFPVRVLFLRPTIRELAASIEAARSTAASEDLLDQEIAGLRERIRQLKMAQGVEVS